MYWTYSSLLALALLVSLPYWLLQGLRHGKYRAGMQERWGRVPERLIEDSRRAIWVHAVSVGEVLAVAGLVTDLQRRLPQYRVVVSTTTDSGQELARTRFGGNSVFYFPLDFGFAIRLYLRHLRPVLVVIAETEFWPNFLRLAHDHGAGIAVVNARISDRSLPGYRLWRGILARVLQPVDLFLAQTEEDGRRLAEIGAPLDRIRVTGNLKFDVSPPSPSPFVDSFGTSLQHSGGSPVFVCGSTVEGEELLLLRAFQHVLASYPRAVTILAPRHPERFAEVAELLGKLAVPFCRRSTWRGEPLAGGVLLVDSIGELASLYALGDVAFVGGSLVPRGGHNILEPAQYGLPIVVGNHTENFRDVIRLFQSRSAVRVAGPAELPVVFMELASNEAERQALGSRAAETLRAQLGATKRTLEALEALLDERTPERSPVGAQLPAISGKEEGRVTPPR
jgi:3-deoxy-D-manno-octulosonic-acid transferase